MDRCSPSRAAHWLCALEIRPKGQVHLATQRLPVPRQAPHWPTREPRKTPARTSFVPQDGHPLPLQRWHVPLPRQVEHWAIISPPILEARFAASAKMDNRYKILRTAPPDWLSGVPSTRSMLGEGFPSRGPRRIDCLCG